MSKPWFQSYTGPLPGILLPIELSLVPFDVNRIFLVTDVPVGGIRGQHAHRTGTQLLICAAGKVSVIVDNGRSLIEHELARGNAVIIPPLHWAHQVFDAPNSILLVLASNSYDPSDYIVNRGEFYELVSNA